MKTMKLATEHRETAGKGAARKLRASGRIPAVLYGHREETLEIAVGEQEMRRLLTSSPDTTIVHHFGQGYVRSDEPDR